jgi:hypothetical protein
MEVTGGATVTWSSNEGTVTGNPIGMASNLTFKGSGELDNGTSYTMGIYHDDKNAFSSADLAITMNSLGSITIGQATGGLGIDAYDDKMPTAWEETWGTSLSTGVDLISGVGASTAIQYKTPSILGSTIAVAYSGSNDGNTTGDKTGGGSVSTYKQSGYDVVLDMNPSFGTEALSGWKVFAGYSITDRDSPSTPAEGDHEEATVGSTLAFGPINVGYQRSVEFTGSQTSGETEYYGNNMLGIAWNINDNLSVSYGNMESRRHIIGSGQGIAKTVDIDADTWQIAIDSGDVKRVIIGFGPKP